MLEETIRRKKGYAGSEDTQAVNVIPAVVIMRVTTPAVFDERTASGAQ